MSRRSVMISTFSWLMMFTVLLLMLCTSTMTRPGWSGAPLNSRTTTITCLCRALVNGLRTTPLGINLGWRTFAFNFWLTFTRDTPGSILAKISRRFTWAPRWSPADRWARSTLFHFDLRSNPSPLFKGVSTTRMPWGKRRFWWTSCPFSCLPQSWFPRIVERLQGGIQVLHRSELLSSLNQDGLGQSPMRSRPPKCFECSGAPLKGDATTTPGISFCSAPAFTLGASRRRPHSNPWSKKGLRARKSQLSLTLRPNLRYECIMIYKDKILGKLPSLFASFTDLRSLHGNKTDKSTAAVKTAYLK